MKPLPRAAVYMFVAGVARNRMLGVLLVPDLRHVFGTAPRDAGLIAMGYAIPFKLGVAGA